MNNSIRKAIRKKNHIHYRAKSTNNPDHWSQYKHLRNDVLRLVREAKTEYRNKLTSQLMNKSIPPDKWQFYFQREYSNFCLPFPGLWNNNQPGHIF
jgi:hypothetical protein